MNYYFGNYNLLVATNYVTKWWRWEIYTPCCYHKIYIWPHSYPVWLSIDCCYWSRYTFINDVIHYFTNHFILRHFSSTMYYPQWNKQANQIY
jgi:hypothetical protein